MKVGALYRLGNCDFTVWAPFKKNVQLKLGNNYYPMQKTDMGYWHISLKAKPGQRYLYRLDSIERPDPASGYQPEGVHGPSEIINHSFNWQDKDWKNISLKNMIIYELHVATFTEKGTFEAIITRLEQLKRMGVNTIELMPVAQFPGKRNWGYDGVYPYAVQNSYGGPNGLKKLVNACHKKGFAVVLDVVYNHLGPEGNYFHDFAPYFTDKYNTPWGPAMNFDDSYNDEVRNYFIENALYWFREFHIDGLRLDAVHAILDMSAKPFLQQLSKEVKKISSQLQKPLYLFPETNLNKSALVKPVSNNGYGLDSVWLDDFHHSIHALLTGERDGYYQDYGQLKHIAKCINKGHVYDGIYSESRKCSYGDSSATLSAEKFIAFIQNHDQVGNRLKGERLSTILDFESLKLATGLLMFSPYIPLIFMGEEYAEDNPFLYFIDHSDQKLVDAVREGRKREFASFNWKGEPADPKSIKTFNSSILDWNKRNKGKHKIMREFYTELIRLRKNEKCRAFVKGNLLLIKKKARRLYSISGKNKKIIMQIHQKKYWILQIKNGTGLVLQKY